MRQLNPVDLVVATTLVKCLIISSPTKGRDALPVFASVITDR